MKATASPPLLPGISTNIAATNDLIRKAAANDDPVFLTGEVGTEKSFAAKLIHQLSIRASRPISKVGVSWKLPPDLAQHFEQSSGGTLVIHLQKEFPIDMQYTLVEVASDGAFADPMTGKVVQSDIRIIVMTSLDVETLTRKASLLPELKEVLFAQHIEVPPLRKRMEDIPALVRYALRRAHDTGRTTALGVDPQVLTLFRQWHWPGNAEDLMLVTAQAAIAARGELVALEDLPEAFVKQMSNEALETARAVHVARKGPAAMTAPAAPPPKGSREVSTAEVDPQSAPPPQPETHDDDPDRTEFLTATATPVAADPPTDPSPAVPASQIEAAGDAHEEGDEPPTAQAAATKRILQLTRRLIAQSALLRSQMTGPLEQGEGAGGVDAQKELENLNALEQELDRGLEMVHALRRQVALLNVRQQQSAETVRDLIQRINMMGPGGTPDSGERTEMSMEARELAETLDQIDQIVQRVSQEVPMFGQQIEKLLSAPLEGDPRQ